MYLGRFLHSNPVAPLSGHQPMASVRKKLVLHQFTAEDALLKRAALAVVDEVEQVVVALAQLHVDGPLPVPEAGSAGVTAHVKSMDCRCVSALDLSESPRVVIAARAWMRVGKDGRVHVLSLRVAP